MLEAVEADCGAKFCSEDNRCILHSETERIAKEIQKAPDAEKLFRMVGYWLEDEARATP